MNVIIYLYLYIVIYIIRSSEYMNQISSQDFHQYGCMYIIRSYVLLDDSSKFHVFLQVTYDRLLQRKQIESYILVLNFIVLEKLQNLREGIG